MTTHLIKNPNSFVRAFISAYLTAALWSSANIGEHATAENLDGQYKLRDIECKTYIDMVKDCCSFIAQMLEVVGNVEELDRLDAAQCGHDFWLTRNGHGSGFWGRKELEANGFGEKLTELCKKFGEYNLVGDGKKVSKL